tara:strand:- start:649 stop:1524 length:876 start_codon:yes stop_codon:yes gene_type:complete
MVPDSEKMDSLNIISGSQLRKFLVNDFLKSKKEIIIISPYITDPAVDDFVKVIPRNVIVKIICRLLPIDVAYGSCSISALKKGIEANWLIYRLDNLHAKIYSIDDNKIYSGSANATANGLMIHAKGNIEACNEVSPSPENKKFISDIFDAASPVDMQVLIDMEKYIKENVNIHKNNENLDWPEEILPENKTIWVRDFMVLDELDSAAIINSKAVKWLINKLKEAEDCQMHYGKITKCLHDDLQDDPAPYRSSVKELLSSLLKYVSMHMKDKIEITIPGKKSQLVKFRGDVL